MSGRSFFDTNVLIYSDDSSDAQKHDRAIELLKQARGEGTGVLSTQVLQEYFAVATRKLGVPAEIAKRKVEIFARFDLVQIDLPTILAAIDLHRLHQLSIWDSLIVHAARQARCKVLYSEDMHHGWRLDGLEIVNPFASS